MGQGLHVLHQGRGATQAALAHPRRLERGQRGTAAEPVHHRRLLAGQEPRRGLRDRHGEPVQAAGGPVGQRAQDLRAGGSVQVEVGLGGADRFGGQLQAVEHEVRRELQQELVLVAGRLALRAVGHDHRAALLSMSRAHAGPGDRGQLPVHREGRAAAAGEAGRLDVCDERAGLVAVRRGTVASQVGAQVLRGGRQQAGQPGRLPGCPAWRRLIHHGGHRVTWPVRCCAKIAATRRALGTCRAA